jgi:nucleoside-diphosphate-sugar epimerase
MQLPTDILIVGCGDLGTTLGQDLVLQGYRVAGVRRTPQPLPGGISTIAADVTDPASLAALAGLRPAILIYSVAASEQSDEAYRAQYVEGLRNTLNVLAPLGSVKHAFFVSSTRPYGQSSQDLLDEATPAQPSDFGGHRLLEAESLLATAPFPGTVLRLSGIYGPGRTRLLKLATQTAHWPAQNSWTNRIHRDDAAAFIAFLVQRALEGGALESCYIVTDSTPAPQHEVLRWIADEMGRKDLPAAPVVGGGKPLSNARMLATGFHLRYPSYREGYARELQAFLSKENQA